MAGLDPSAPGDLQAPPPALRVTCRLGLAEALQLFAYQETGGAAGLSLELFDGSSSSQIVLVLTLFQLFLGLMSVSGAE